jgi:hypothetical protein
MSEESVIRERTNRAPLAQLRDVNERAWKVLMAVGTTRDPEFTTTVQCIAAHLLGAHDLANLIEDTGFYPLSAAVLSEWPDWTKPPIEPPPCDHSLDEFSLVEDGYQRQWHTRIDEDTKVIRAGYNGSSDWTDDGDGNYFLQCGMCLARREVPFDYEIDWN